MAKRSWQQTVWIILSIIVAISMVAFTVAPAFFG